MTRPPELPRLYQWVLLLIVIHSRHLVRGTTTPTTYITSTSPVGNVTLDPPGTGITCADYPHYCRNNGTCREPLNDELWECSGDAGTGPLKCVCPPTHTGSRCETKLSCDLLSCATTDVCDYNWEKQKLECIPKNTSGQAPTCRPGVQEIEFQYDRNDPAKRIACFDMYAFNDSSFCQDADDSLTYFISDQPPQLPYLFCLVVDYQTYQTCLRVNGTHRNSINMTSVDVTIKAEEYSVLLRTASLKLRIIFNTPPSVKNGVIQWVVNTAETMLLDVIQEAQASGKSQLKLADINFSNENIVSGSVNNGQFLQLSLKGSPTYQIKKLKAAVKITDSGIPQLSTSVAIQITLVRLKCEPIDTLLIDKHNLAVGRTFPIGRIECRGTMGYQLNYIKAQTGALPGLSLSVNSANEIVLNVNEILTSRLPDTGSSRLEVSFIKLPRVKIDMDFNFNVYFYSLIWFKSESPNGLRRQKRESVLTNEIKTEINNNLSSKVAVHFIRVRDEGWVDILLKSSDETSLKTDVTSVKNVLSSGKLGTIVIDKTSVSSTQRLNHIFNPEVKFQDSNQKILQGSTVKVNCEVNFINVFGKAILSWTLNGFSIQQTSTSRFQISTNTNSWTVQSQLTIKNIKNMDNGSLGCYVKDIYGLEKSSRLDLPVISLPIVKVSETVFVRAGQQINLNCTLVSNGGDTTTLKWFKGTSEIKKGVVPKLVLTITTSEDTERSCVGSNSAGSGQSKVTTISIIRGAACTSGTDSRNTTWLQATAGKVSILPCPSGYDGTVTRKCSDDGVWLQPDYKNCIQSSLVNLQDQIKQIESGILISTPDKIMSNMSAITKQSTLNSGEVVVMTEALQDLTTIIETGLVNNTDVQPETVNRWASEAVNLVGNLIEPKQSIEDVQIENTSVSLLLLDTMDDVSKLVGVSLLEGETTSITTDNIVLTVGKVDPFNLVNVSYPDNGSNQTSSLSVDLPSDIFTSDTDFEGKTYSIIDYDNLTSLPADTTQKLSNTSSSSTTFQINSDIVSINIFGETFNSDQLPAEVVFSFSHLNSSLNSATCSFWNVDQSGWDNTGCRLLSTNQSSTTCSCNHLTNFAILMKPTQVSLKDEEILSTITLIGATISIFCLLVTVLVYAFVWRYVRSDRAVLLVHLCVALIIALVFFLFGVDKTQNSAVCTAMAVCLQYFYLVVFFLMLGEGIEVLVTIVKVFSSRSKLREILLMGWGVPLIIVAISAGVTELEGYGNSKFCWLSTDGGLIWAFLGPALFIIFVNVIIVIKITHALLNTRVMINKDTRIKAKAALRSICVLLPVLGASWAFGVLSVNEDLVIFDYIFSILNSLQGLFIFLFHCVINRKVREGLANRRRRYRSRHTSLSAQKSGSRSAFEKSRNSRKRASSDETRQAMMIQQGQINAGYFGGHRMDEIPRKKPIERLRYPMNEPKNYLNHFPEVSDGYSNLSVSEDPSPIFPNQSLVQPGLNQEFFKPAMMRGNSVLSGAFSERSGSSNSDNLSTFRGLPRPKIYF